MPVRVYTLLDVLKQLNSDSTQYIAPNPNEIVSQFMSGAETLIAQPSWTEVDYTTYAFNVADQDGPTGFWILGDNVGSTSAFDSMPYLTGGKHPAAVTGTVTFGGAMPTMPGVSSALFDGSTGYADAGSGSFFDPSGTKTFSIEAWVKPTTVDTTFRRVCGMEATVNHGATLYWQSTAGWGFLRGDSSAGNDVATGGTPSTSAWAHVVGTYDGTNMRLYVNGSLVTTTASSRSVDTASATFRMGGTQASLNGGASMSSIAVYPIALSAAQVLNHYNWGTATPARAAGGSYASSGSLAAIINSNPSAGGYWRLNDPIGSTTAADISGNSKDAAGGGSGYQFGWPGRGMPWFLPPAGPLAGDANRVASFDARYPGRLATPSMSANLSAGAMTFMAWVYAVPDPRPLTTAGSFEQFATRFAPGFDPSTIIFNVLGHFPNIGLALHMHSGDTLFHVEGWLNGNATDYSSVPFNTWTHIAVVYTGSGSNSRAVYVNGSLVGTDTTGTAADFSGTMRIGEDERWTGYDTTMNGCISEAAIFGYALSAAQVLAIYNAGITAQTSMRYGLANYPNPPKRGNNLWGSAVWGSFTWG